EVEMLLNIILWIIVGGLAGWIASMIMGTNASMGPIANIIVGIVGAVIGGFLVGLFGIETTTFSIVGLVVAILGAIVLLFLIGLVQRST
ncbi:MAG: GlsB/YeaQ/YmgE family stress response membrane protein, partial [Anaerolineae bacterium]|nr:GlsB/YeaQ/YmgE family stress response membrane protein [Anaerolineae bacterium]